MRATRATSVVIARAYTLSLRALVRRCHFEEVTLRVLVEETFTIVSVTSTE